MYATLDYVKSVFECYNRLCFDGRLPMLPLRLTDSLSHLGAFVHPTVWPDDRPRGAGECHLRISRRLDRSQEELVDTIVHEMIHYYIWYNRISDTAPHGTVFRTMMNSLNKSHGLNMTVRKRMEAAELDTDTRQRPHLICITHWADGRRLITVCAQKKLFEIHDAFAACDRVLSMEWWWSADPWFNRFGSARTAKAMLIDPADYDTHVRTAVPCSCDGHRFVPHTKK